MTARWPIACRTMLVLCVLLALAGCERSGEAFNAEDVAANNRGVALMGYFDYSAARDTFDALVQRRPGWHDARLNLAVATLNRQQEGDEQRALAIVDTVLQEDPENLRASYIAGLLYLYLGETEAALARFNTLEPVGIVDRKQEPCCRAQSHCEDTNHASSPRKNEV